MRVTLLLFLLLLYFLPARTQVLSVQQLLTATSMAPHKAENFIGQKGFIFSGVQEQKDTIVKNYVFRAKRRSKDSIERKLSRYCLTEETCVTYQTGSLDEYRSLRKQLAREGFIYNGTIDSTIVSKQFFQDKDISVEVTVDSTNLVPVYLFRMQKRILPSIKEIVYGDDLLVFNSHQNLAYVFGEQNIKKDIYFFSEKEFSRCSILFPNTERQAVFVWKDEQNDRQLQQVVLGGQIKLASTLNDDRIIAENTWMLKNRVHAGMSLRELRRLHADNFNFHSPSSSYSGMVIPASSGNIDFEKEGIVLACLNCPEDDKLTFNADDAIQQGQRFFVFTIMLYPNSYAAN